jgi:type VI protein secretion system component Hcp
MKTFMAAVVILLGSSTLLSGQTSSSTQGGKRGGAQTACASTETGKGENKFNGQIYSAAPGSFQVSSGKETAAVSYNNSLLVCENGQIANTGDLLPGATVEVIGPMIKKGNSYVVTATKAFISAAAPGSSSGGAQVSTQGSASMPNSSSSISGSVNKVNTQNSNAIACNSLQFEVGASAASTASGAGARRVTVPVITCRRTVDQESMELLEDAATNKRLAGVTLNWQGVLVATLSNADVSSVTFTSDSSGQVVEISFASEKAEISQSPSGVRVSF